MYLIDTFRVNTQHTHPSLLLFRFEKDIIVSIVRRLNPVFVERIVSFKGCFAYYFFVIEKTKYYTICGNRRFTHSEDIVNFVICQLPMRQNV